MMEPKYYLWYSPQNDIVEIDWWDDRDTPICGHFCIDTDRMVETYTLDWWL